MVMQGWRRRFAAGLCLGALLGAATLRPAEAVPLVWTLEGSFAGPARPAGGVELYPIGGSFVFDAASGAYSDWNISFNVPFLTGGRLTPANATLGPGSTAARLSLLYRAQSGTPGDFSDDFSVFDGALGLNLTAPLTDAGGTVSLAESSSWFLEVFIFSIPNTFFDAIYGLDLVSGTVTAAPPPVAVPAPAGLGLILPAIGMLAAVRRRARRV